MQDVNERIKKREAGLRRSWRMQKEENAMGKQEADKREMGPDHDGLERTLS